MKIYTGKAIKLQPQITKRATCGYLNPGVNGLGLFIFLLFFFFGIAKAEPSVTDEQILWAIFRAEGGYKAQYFFGIRSIRYKNFQDAKKICLNTIRRNRERYANYGYKQYNSFLEFLASRYAPINVSNDPKGLNKNWLKNVRFYLRKKKT